MIIYLKPPVTLWQRCLLKGEGQTEKENVEEYLRDCLRNCSKLPTAANSLEGGDITIPLTQSICYTYRNLPICLCCFHMICDGLCILIGSLTGTPSSQPRRIPQVRLHKQCSIFAPQCILISATPAHYMTQC